MILLQIEFAFEGPFGRELAALRAAQADRIAGEPGLIWKIWTEDPDDKKAGGVYLFETREAARSYAQRQQKILDERGIRQIRVRLSAINEELSAKTNAPLSGD